MQSFDMQYEAQNRLAVSDTIMDRNAAAYALQTNSKLPPSAFKTTDQLMHERMARSPFVQYNQFNVAAFADYGKQKYDKHEDFRMVDGQVDKTAAKTAPLLGNPQALEAQRPRGRKRMMMEQQNRMMQDQRNNWGTGRQWGNNGT
jgi:organic radical activating enzyme